MDSLADIKSQPYRNNHRLFPVSTYTEPVHSNTSHFVHHPKPQYSTGLQKPQKSLAQQQQQHSPSGNGSLSNLSQTSKLGSPATTYPQPSWQSVATLINDFERSSDPQQQQHQQPQKYTYLDPNKTHRVPNPALKAFQKNAVQSYFERQQQQQQQRRLIKCSGAGGAAANRGDQVYDLNMQQQQHYHYYYHQQQRQQQPYHQHERLRQNSPTISTTTTTTTSTTTTASTYPRCTSPPDVVPRPQNVQQKQATPSTIPEEYETNGIVVENYFNEYERQEIVHHPVKRKSKSTATTAAVAATTTNYPP
uniref:Dictyostelium (Slime Mold) REP protein n=1 Tax=Musca domestica TaxID=7370 RepID=T1PM73_MUSDO